MNINIAKLKLSLAQERAQETLRKIEWWADQEKWLSEAGYWSDVKNARIYMAELWANMELDESDVTYHQNMISMCIPAVEVDLDCGTVGLCACGNEYADTWCQNCHENGDEQESDPPRS